MHPWNSLTSHFAHIAIKYSFTTFSVYHMKRSDKGSKLAKEDDKVHQQVTLFQRVLSQTIKKS